MSVFVRMSVFLKIVVRSQDIKDITSTEILNDKIALKYNDMFDEITNRMTCKVISRWEKRRRGRLFSSLGELSWNEDERKGEKKECITFTLIIDRLN